MELTLCFVFLTIFGVSTGHLVQTFTPGIYNQGISGFSGSHGFSVTPGTPVSVTPGYPGFSITSRIPGFSGISVTPEYLETSRVPGFSGISDSPVYPYGNIYDPLCQNQITKELVSEFTKAISETATYLYKKTAAESDNHFISSPFTTWLALAAIAEGAEESMKQTLFSFLNLPRDRCVRQLYYKLATAKLIPTNELLVQRNQQFIFDSNVRLNPIWQQFVTSNNLIDITTSPFKTYPEKEAELFRNVFNAQLPNLNLNGNSIILESLDYRGLWTTAFADAIIESGPFYNTFGEQIATIEYMKTRTPANMAYLPEINLKVIELPVGNDRRYKLLLGLTVDVPLVRSSVDSLRPSIISDILLNLKLNPVPVEVVVPRMMMTSEVDVRKLLNDLNIDPIWEDPIATSNISTPSALPSSYIQRITATIDTNAIQPSTPRFSNFVPPLPQQKFNPYNTTITPVGGDFIANRPFLFALINSDDYYYLGAFAGAFSKPNN